MRMVAVIVTRPMTLTAPHVYPFKSSSQRDDYLGLDIHTKERLKLFGASTAVQ